MFDELFQEVMDAHAGPGCRLCLSRRDLEREHGGRIRMTIGCDGGDHEYNLNAGEDDKLFKLDKAPASTCETMQAEYDKLMQ